MPDPEPHPHPHPPTHLLFLSDLHLSGGHLAPIFAGERELPALIDEFAAPGRAIILNGDAIDFLLNDEPLSTDPAVALTEAAAVVQQPAAAAVLQALGRALAAGAVVRWRLGNHDVELALPAVQDLLRASLGQPEQIASRLDFENGDKPGTFDLNGLRVLYTHGEHTDRWNRVDYDHLGTPDFAFAAGSELVKGLINPLKARGLHFIDLLKPDFHGAVMTALAVDPGAVRALSPALALRLMQRLRQATPAPLSFAADDGSADPFDALLDQAALRPEERQQLQALLLDAPIVFNLESEVSAALGKLLRAALSRYAELHRAVAGQVGARFFELAPRDAEWAEARRLADQHGATVVVMGHTHAARLRAEPGLIYANSGTWIRLMQLPAPDAPIEDWTDFLATLRQNPSLDPDQPGVPVLRRLTAVEVEALPDGGARVALLACGDGAREALVEARAGRGGEA